VNGDRLDAQQRAVLWRIYQGEQRFPPPERQDRVSCWDYDYLVEMLISLQRLGFIHQKDLTTQRNTGIDGCRYWFAMVDGLTYQGEKVARSLDPAPAATR